MYNVDSHTLFLDYCLEITSLIDTAQIFCIKVVDLKHICICCFELFFSFESMSWF